LYSKSTHLYDWDVTNQWGRAMVFNTFVKFEIDYYQKNDINMTTMVNSDK